MPGRPLAVIYNDPGQVANSHDNIDKSPAGSLPTARGQLCSNARTVCWTDFISYLYSLFSIEFLQRWLYLHPFLDEELIIHPVLWSETAILWQDRSQTGLRLGRGLIRLLMVLVLVLVLYFWSCVVHDKTLCDMIMLKCSKHLFFRAISTETLPNVTGHHFFDVFCT